MASKTVIGSFVRRWVLSKLGIRGRHQDKIHRCGPHPLEHGFGAAMLQMHQHLEIKSGHVAKCRLTRCKQSGKKGEKSAHRGSLSLDNRGPHKCSASFPTSYGLSATNCTSAHWPFRTTSRDGSS